MALKLPIILTVILMVTRTSPSTIARTTEATTFQSPGSHQLLLLIKNLVGSLDSDQPMTIIKQVFGGLDNGVLEDFLKKLTGNSEADTDNQKSSGFLILSTLLQELTKAEELRTMIADGLGINGDFMKPLSRLVSEMIKLNTKYSYKSIKFGLVGDETSNDAQINNIQNTIEGSSADIQPPEAFQAVQPAINAQFLKLAKNIFEEEFGSMDSILGQSSSQDPNGLLADFNATTSSVWMMIKSTWQRVLAYVKEENSLTQFMQLTPVKIIDRILSLGDDVNLLNFLSKKLDPQFAMFLVTEIDPYLGPLRDFESFYNFTKDYELNGILDYFRSDRFTFTMNTMSRLVQAYLEDKISSDLVNQYIDLISFNNTELQEFYKSVMSSQNEISTEDNTNSTQRFKRNVLDHIVSSFKFGDFLPIASQPESEEVESKTLDVEDYKSDEATDYEPDADKAESEIMSRQGYGMTSYKSSGGYGGGGYGGGGYGGGGYGGAAYMNTLDPYVVLGALALGTLLGFLLFRLLRGTRRGRRDIGDGSLSLWLSDMPDKVLPWDTSVERMRQDAHSFNVTEEEEFNLPESLRGNVWSSDPLVGDDLLEEELEEDDVADHLNHLWRVFQDSSSPACVHSRLCSVVANTTPGHLTGKDSSVALIMASVGNLMGVVRSGQLVDHVTNNLVMGNSYTCPNPIGCHQYLL